jgi:hypothetical protein
MVLMDEKFRVQTQLIIEPPETHKLSWEGTFCLLPTYFYIDDWSTQ